MNLLYANPLSLVYNYLALFFYGMPLRELHSAFSAEDQKYADPISPPQSKPEAYDFIVVGGGSAGSVVASRLTQENFTVLLLEAGGNPMPLTSVPSMACLNLGNFSNIDWLDQTVPQKKACHGLKENSTTWNHGKGLGGSSSINYMLYMRGNPKDYDNWAKETGDPQWTYENLLPLFKKLETYNGQFPNDKLHGNNGPLHVSPSTNTPLGDEWFQIAQDLGFPTNQDPNGYQNDSFFPYSMTMKGGTRHSTHRAYLYPILFRKNLKIRIYSTVTKIELNSENRAVGVHYVQNGQSRYASANLEVIVSSGSIGSPHLLMLSGIGPKKHLESVGVKCKVDLDGVGQNLQDHLMSWVGPITLNASKVTNPIEEFSEETLHEFILNGTGPFSGMGVGGAALTRSSVNPGWADLYYILNVFKYSSQLAQAFETAFNYRPGFIQKYWEPTYGQYGFLLCFTLGLPKSRGQLKLRSSDPKDRPSIDPNYFGHDDDLQAMLEGFKFGLDMINKSKTMQKIEAKLTTAVLPGCESLKDDEYLKCVLRHWTHTMWHYSGTCKMGKGVQDHSVVDSNLRVFGTKGLRVIDASVMPQVTNTNTNLPTIVIGEKGSELIKKFYRPATSLIGHRS